ncbi:MAG: hypothetical protein WA832_07200 [Bradyrhizobium sp.]|uniref:hypothetical protein n=1 Tax=Bradyrhizobium sp. TaxID=376 RepID=UPI003C5B8D9D
MPSTTEVDSPYSILLSVVGNAECELTAEWHKKTVREAGRFCYLRIGVARLVELLFRISIVLARSLALLARFRAAALLTGLLTRRLILLAGLVLVRHVVSFHGNTVTTALSPRRSDKRKWQFALLAKVRLTYSGLYRPVGSRDSLSLSSDIIT